MDDFERYTLTLHDDAGHARAQLLVTQDGKLLQDGGELREFVEAALAVIRAAGETPAVIPAEWRVPSLAEMEDIPPYNPGGAPGYDPSPGVPDGYRPGDK